MRKSVLWVASLSAVALLTTGCQSSLTGDTYSRDEARTVQTVRLGTIESLRPVKIEGTKTPIGTGAGAADRVRAVASTGGSCGRPLTTAASAPSLKNATACTRACAWLCRLPAAVAICCTWAAFCCVT